MYLQKYFVIWVFGNKLVWSCTFQIYAKYKAGPEDRNWSLEQSSIVQPCGILRHVPHAYHLGLGGTGK